MLIRVLVSRKDHESEQGEDWASENKLQLPFPEEHICESVRHSRHRRSDGVKFEGTKQPPVK